MTREVIARRRGAAHHPRMNRLPSFSDVLRETRQARRLSQHELSRVTGVSQRHLSYLECGRARPSRPMVLALARSLGLRLREQNRWLTAAGFAPRFAERSLEDADMRPVHEALARLLEHAEPFPALVVDRAWNLVRANQGALRLFTALLGDVTTLWRRIGGEAPMNLLQLSFHPDGLQRHIVNRAEVTAWVLARTRREAEEHPEVRPVLDTVLGYPQVSEFLGALDPEHLPPPVLVEHYRFQGEDYRLFSVLSSFGTPLDVTADALRVEHFFPADAATRDHLLRLAGA